MLARRTREPRRSGACERWGATRAPGRGGFLLGCPFWEQNTDIGVRGIRLQIVRRTPYIPMRRRPNPCP